MTHSRSHRGCEVFRFLTRGWCITQALELIEADPAAAEFIEAADNHRGWTATST